ncbi:16S rRNA (guanine966-N2)-methyltransferase [Sphingomonas jejuensis]|uniref:16S rRNA (Guanine966-N2)-methyltransferase n=1 Tax=Sphingomonas jejuensis TaxID=904715 RepID=A0ABX0XLJ7_9SPHN|nr:RsmD family RNA methyltransferase [Sphingomonas jejuensis]NJC33590.1 16S rRNA (guanine966-N2)-methyltransferase [Sphingomonas jejuensis]
MRIIAGRWRGRPLVAPPGLQTRPTADRLRGALFSMLASRVGTFDGLLVADLFAGSGALGLEAVSRGAARAIFVDNGRDAVAALRQNVDRLGAAAAADIRPVPVESLGSIPTPVDLLLMDPPYATGAGQAALVRLQTLNWIAPSAWIAIETGRGEPVSAPGFIIDAEREHGAGRLTLLRAG